MSLQVGVQWRDHLMGLSPYVLEEFERLCAALQAWTVNGIRMPELADSAAANGTLYYSTTQSKLVFKDAGGTVNPLY